MTFIIMGKTNICVRKGSDPMDLMEMIRNRRSVRTYRKGEIEEETLRKVLEAGLLAPSGRNRQPWELIVVRDPQTLKQLSECRAGELPGCLPVRQRLLW